VLDWGVAKIDGDDANPAHSGGVASENDTADGVFIGTPGFMAPEQSARANRVDGRADIFALGEMLRQLAGAERVPPPLNAVIARATAPNVADRYATVDALAADVRAWLDGSAVSAYRESVAERVLRFYRRNNALILLLLAYLTMRLFILWWRGV
jgi:serine/threonine protein kinase